MEIKIKLKRTLINIDYWVLITSLMLIRLPIAFGFRQNPEIRLLFLTPIIVVVLKNIILSIILEKLRFKSTLFFLFLVYCFFLSIAFFRTLITNTFLPSTVLGNFFVWLLMAIFGLSLFVTAKNEQTKVDYRRGIFISINIYFTLNLILYIMGITSPEVLYMNSSHGALLKSIGINSNRVLFPLASGINSFGATAGIGLVASFVILVTQGSKKIDKLFSCLGGLSSFLIILLTDSRGALAFSIAIILLILVLPPRWYPSLRWLPFLAPVLPILLIFILNMLPESLIIALSRSGNDLSNMSNRLNIWNIILNELINFKWIHMIGFGYRGQVNSGLASSYSYLFASYTNSDVSSAHNFLLQNIIDVGYIGAFISLLFLNSIMGKFALRFENKVDDFTSKTMLFVMVYLLFVGITEAVLAPDYQEVFIIFLLFSASAMTNIAIYPTNKKLYSLNNPLIEENR